LPLIVLKFGCSSEACKYLNAKRVRAKALKVISPPIVTLVVTMTKVEFNEVKVKSGSKINVHNDSNIIINKIV